MGDINSIFKLVRLVVFGVATLFAFIAIVLGGLLTHFSNMYLGGFYSFAALGIAVGLLTILTIPVMLTLSIIRKGAFTSMIAIEIAWVWLLWILWLSVGGSAAGFTIVEDCSNFAPVVRAACSEVSAMTAFGFLSWLNLLFYNVLLISLTFRQHLRGHTGIWTQDVTDTDFMAPGNTTTQIVYDPKVNPGYAPQYPPAGTPQQSYAQPQMTSPYVQPQATGSFTNSPQAGASLYPQV